MPPLTIIDLGQIQALHIGLTAPLNKKILWYDDNPGVKIIKYYDTITSTWVSIICANTTFLNLLNPIERFVVGAGGQSVFNTTLDVNDNCKMSIQGIIQDTLLYTKTGQKQVTHNETILEGAIVLIWN